MYYLLESGETLKTENRMFFTTPGEVELTVLSGEYTPYDRPRERIHPDT